MTPEFKEFKFKIRVYETDFKERIRIDSISNYMQECAEEHAKLGKLGYDGMIEKGVFWVLSKVQIEILEMPKINDEITIKTWSKGLTKLYAIRDFEIRNGNNQVIIKASTNWLVLDAKSNRPVRPNDIMHQFPKLEQESLPIVTKRIEIEDNIAHLIDERKVRYSDIDVNNHVNNARYLTWIMDAFDLNWHEKTIRRIEIDYMNESKMNDHIQIFSDSNQSKIHIKNQDGKTLICAEINGN